MKCLWHECGKEFVPARKGQHFCCSECRLARSTWKSHRGGPLVDLLLNKDAAGLDAARQKLAEEVANALR